MSSNVNQEEIHQLFGIPPSRSKLTIKGALINTIQLGQHLAKLGLTAEDLKPVDWRPKISSVWNQGQCGSCYAMSATAMLQDRFCIQKDIKGLHLNPALAAQCEGGVSEINAVTPLNRGCEGGLPFDVAKYYEVVGARVSKDSCPDWDTICGGKCSSLPPCDQLQKQCNNVEPVYKAAKGSTRSIPVLKPDGTVDEQGTITNMKKELLNGPFSVVMAVPKDMMACAALNYNYDVTGGVFINGAYNDVLDKLADKYEKNNPGKSLKQAFDIKRKEEWGDLLLEDGSMAGHALEIVGWDIFPAGSYGKIPAWIVRNSWGPVFGDKGYFKYAMNDSIGSKAFNKYLGLDIPINAMIIVSTGAKTDLGTYYGGGTACDPDLSTGDPKGTVYKGGIVKKSNTMKMTSDDLMRFGIVAGSIVGVALIAYLIYWFINRKKKRSRK